MSWEILCYSKGPCGWRRPSTDVHGLMLQSMSELLDTPRGTWNELCMLLEKKGVAALAELFFCW